MKAAIYARVSTKDKGQDTENQLLQLREYCARQDWTIAGEYIDEASGKSGDRTAFRRLFIDASRRQFDLVIVWALDRFTREGVLETFEYIRDLSKYGVQFESYTEAHFRTTGPAGELMLAVAAWIAKQERIRISERTKAGLERAVKAGKKLGPPVKVFDRNRVHELRKAGHTIRAIATLLGISKSLVGELLASANGSPKRSHSRLKKQGVAAL